MSRAKLLSLVLVALVSIFCFSSLAESADGRAPANPPLRSFEGGSGNGLMLRPGALGGNGVGVTDSRSRADKSRGSSGQGGMGSTGVNGSIMGGGGAGGGAGSAGGGTGGPGGGSGRAGR
ncbi:hypothetical protein [Pseudomonas chlororaphis]|uniref:hypothetical protein n=1 Tax=Pseudomonas chlororaphis TaxID=587753 RepID=UPI002407C04E|nr:hypothetical protein [Pseudomonas chlororaphis]